MTVSDPAQGFTTYRGYPMFSLGDNWCAKCSACGVALTKFAFTEEDACREAGAALKDHRCRGSA